MLICKLGKTNRTLKYFGKRRYTRSHYVAIYFINIYVVVSYNLIKDFTFAFSFVYLAHGARVSLGGMAAVDDDDAGRDVVLVAIVRKVSVGGIILSSVCDGVQFAGNNAPKIKCCTTGRFDNTSPSYNLSSPKDILYHVAIWLISFNMGDDSKNGTFFLMALINRIHP